MEAKLFKSVTDIDEKQWDSIVGEDRIICSHRYLKAIEKSNICDCDYFYPVVYENGKIAAHTCVYSMSFELDIFAKGAAKKIINFTRNFFPNFLILKFVECGTPVALGNTISFAEGVDKKRALDLIIKKMEEAAENKKIGLLLLRDFYDEDLPFFNNLESGGFKVVPNLPNSFFDVKWDSFDEYLGTLRYRYRRNIRNNMKKIAGDKISLEIVDNFSHLADELVKLWKNCYDHAKEYRREILTKEFFTNIDTCLGHRSKLILVRVGAKILGYGLILDDDFTVRSMFIGIDYQFNKDCETYYNIWYSVFKFGMHNKKKVIDMGLSTYETKLGLGARITPLYMYMRHSNAVLNILLTGLFKLMTPARKYSPKRVFKKANSV